MRKEVPSINLDYFQHNIIIDITFILYYRSFKIDEGSFRMEFQRGLLQGRSVSSLFLEKDFRMFHPKNRGRKMIDPYIYDDHLHG